MSLFPLAVLTVAVIAGTSIQTAAGAVSQTTALSAGGRLITSARPVVATAPTISTRAIRFPIATRAVRYVPAHPVTVLPSRQRPPSPPASRPSTEKASAPVIVTISVPNSPLPATGGSANVTVTTRGATDCQLTLVNHPRLAMHFDQQRFSCSMGLYRAGITFGANRSHVLVRAVFEFVARTGRLVAQRRVVIAVAAPPPTPTASLTLNEASVPPTGGTIVLRYSSKNASSCSLGSSPAFWNGSNPATVSCNGSYESPVPATTSGRQWTFTFAAASAAGESVSESRTLTERAPPPTPTASLTLNEASVPPTGGTIVLRYSSKNASSCSLGSSPAFWNGSNPATVSCNGSYESPVPATMSGRQWTFTFTAASAAGESVSQSRTLTEQAPTVTSTTVVMDFTSSATDGLSNSLTVDYTASLTATCSYFDGTTGTCALPDGSVSYELDGADQGGNVMSSSSAASNCTGAVGGSTTADGCNVTWATYGDQWLSATYASSTTTSVTQTIEVQVVAPVDMASGLTYSTYDNVGLTGLDDCTMASVADWIETTLGTVPSDQDTVDAYWAAENEFNGGVDMGLSPDQLFYYWTNTGIDGTYLAGDNPVDPGDVETNLDDQYVLMAAVNLPDGFSDGQTGGGHMWIVVGYSDYGPMVVSWGQEFQISWSDFDAWETGIWSIGTTS